MADAGGANDEGGNGGGGGGGNVKVSESVVGVMSSVVEGSSVRFVDEEGRQILYELNAAGVMHYYVNGRHKVSGVKSVYAAGRALHVDGRRLMAVAGCAATVPEADAGEVIPGVMELFAKRSPQTPGATRLLVSILSARGLRDADGMPGTGSSDPYCICEIHGKPGRLKTNFVMNSLNPVWDYVGELGGWCPGDSLSFEVWDKDWFKRDDFLGRAKLSFAGEGAFPSFDGELQLKEAGKGIQAFLHVRVTTGTRRDNRLRQLVMDLQDSSCAVDKRTLERLLRNAQAAGLSGQDAAKASALLELMKATEHGREEELRAAAEAARSLGLDSRPEFGRAAGRLRREEARERLREAEDRQRTLPALEAAIAAAEEAGVDEADLERYRGIATRLRDIREAAQASSTSIDGRAARRHEVLRLGESLASWREYEDLARACLEEACLVPCTGDLRIAIQACEDAAVPEEDLSAPRALLKAMDTLQEALRASAPAAAPVRAALAGVHAAAAAAATALGTGGTVGRRRSSRQTTRATSSEVRAAEETLRELTKAEVAEACRNPSKEALEAATAAAEDCGLQEDDYRLAHDMLMAIEQLDKAASDRKLDVLNAALAAAKAIGLGEAVAEVAKVAGLIRAHAKLREAQKLRRSTGLQDAIAEAKAAGLTPAEYGAAGDALSGIRLEQGVLDRLAKASQAGKMEQLEQAIEAAATFGFYESPECLQARSQLRKLCAKAGLRKALEACQSSDGRPDAHDARALSAALSEFRDAYGASSADLSGGADSEDWAELFGSDEEARDLMLRAEKVQDREDRRRRASASLKKAMITLEREPLQAAVAAAQEAELSEEEVGEAEELLRCLDVLQAAIASGRAERLKAALDDPDMGRLGGAKDLVKAQQMLQSMEAQTKVRKVLAEAKAEGTVGALTRAVEEAQAAGLARCDPDLAEAFELLRKVEAKEVEMRKQALDLLSEAIRGTSVEDLEAAVAAAEAAHLPPSEKVYAKAMDLLFEMREALRLLASAYSEKDLVKALERARKAGLSSNDTYIEAKQQLDMRRETAQRSAHQENVRQALEKALRPPVSRERLERAIRNARVLDVDPNDPLLRAALARLKEIMKVEVNRLTQKIRSGLNQRTLDRDRLDVMQHTKDQLNGMIQSAKDAGVDEADLEDIEKLRKKVHNIVEDLKGSIRVFCRVRPLSDTEKNRGDADIIRQVDPMTLEVTHHTKSLDLMAKTETHTFRYDAAFCPGSQDAIFADCKELVQSALDGYNVTIFAYGQTGAGKTYTMNGNGDARGGKEGIGPRTIDEIYNMISLNGNRMKYTVTASIVELYCNELLDLLPKKDKKEKRKEVEVRWDKDAKEVIYDNLSSEVCPRAQDLRALLAQGMEHRKVAQTLMNHESSRSHLIFIIRVDGVSKKTGEGLRGKIVLVDLAGSERIKKSGAGPQQAREAIEINKSLTALVDVIEALVQGQRDTKSKTQKFVPYRNHKLTQLLQDSLGGPAKALMFVNCSPAASNVMESLSSLRYAARAKNVTNATARTKGGERPTSPGGGGGGRARARTRSHGVELEHLGFAEEADREHEDPVIRLVTERHERLRRRLKTAHSADDVTLAGGAEGGRSRAGTEWTDEGPSAVVHKMTTSRSQEVLPTGTWSSFAASTVSSLSSA